MRHQKIVSWTKYLEMAITVLELNSIARPNEYKSPMIEKIVLANPSGTNTKRTVETAAL
jgi:hypothetical protein